MFKTIARYPDYEINELGEVRRKGSNNIRKVYPINGHPKIILDGKTEYISRLVAETFVPGSEDGQEVNHINRNTFDNRAINLKWASHGEIQKESYKGSTAPGGRVHSKKIKIVETGEEFPSIRACARSIGGVPTGIRRCLNGETETYKGFHYQILV